MSDTSQGPGWWRASDDKWYPPEAHPDHQPEAPAPPAQDAPASFGAPAGTAPGFAAPSPGGSAPPPGAGYAAPPSAGYAAPPSAGYAPPAPQSSGGMSGCAKAAIALVIVIAVVGLMGVLAFLFVIDRATTTLSGMAEDYESMQEIIDDTGIATSSSNVNSPPQFDVELAESGGCVIRSASSGQVDVEVSGAVTNNSSDVSNYYVLIALIDGDTQLANTWATASNVRSGDEQAFSSIYRGAPEAVQGCRIVQVERWSSSGPIPGAVPPDIAGE